MKYLIAYPIRGEAEEYLVKISNGLAKRFKLEPVTNRIPPHLTLKAPFEGNRLFVNSIELTNRIPEIEDILEIFTKKAKRMPLRLKGFGTFNGKAVFMDVHAPKQTHMLLRRLQDQLRNISWLSWQRVEFPLALHATLCYPKRQEQAKEILHALKKERAVFDLSLDVIAILEKPSARWQILREFPILPR